MITVNSKNLLAFVIDYFSSIGCSPAELITFFDARTFQEGIVLNLPAVCLYPGNKPANSKSKQSHIHVTSKSCEFFYPASVLASIVVSTNWESQELKISQANIDALFGKAISKNLSVIDSSMMKKVECRQSQEKQVQLSKITSDDSRFLDLRKGLFENDVMVFLKYRGSDCLFVAGIPKAFYSGKYKFESTRVNSKNEIYSGLVSKKAIPVKKAIENIMEEQTSEEVIESEEPISDAIYQSLVDDAQPSKTEYVPEQYINNNPDGTATISHRPTTNPALGKEAIKDNNYKCAINGEHETFIKPDGTTYMEVHHLITLNRQSEFTNKLDTKANIIPLCPTCHRMLHHGRLEEIKPILKDLFTSRETKLKLSGLEITFEELLKSYE